MSEKHHVSIEELKKVGGGDCSAQEWVVVTTELTDAYEALIDFTSYVFSRVSGGQQ